MGIRPAYRGFRESPRGGQIMVHWKIGFLFCLCFLGQNCQVPCWASIESGRSNPFPTAVVTANPLTTNNSDEEFDELEEELERLTEELKRFEKETEKKIRKDVLPALKKEIEKLRRWLREYYPDREKARPIKI